MISIDQLKNKNIVANLWPMPVARSQDFTAFNYNGGTKPVVSDYNGGVLIDSTAITTVQNIGIEANKSILLQPGTYVFSACLSTTGKFTTQDAVATLFSHTMHYYVVRIMPSDFNSGITSKTFTITRPVSVSLQYKVPPAAKTVVYGCGTYSLQDWNKLQSLGIRWFNPSDKTYANTSQLTSKLDNLQNIASDADFLGAANASPSVMTIKKRMVQNVIPCPQTMRLGNKGNALNFRQSGIGVCENMRMPDCPVPVTSGIHVINVNSSNSGALIDDKTVPVGNYVFAVYAKAAAGVGIKLIVGWDGSSASGLNYFIGDGKWHQYFTTGNITDASVSYACMYNSTDNGGAVGDVYFAAPVFCTALDWNMLQCTNNQYFDGSTNLLSNN
jgi:hypothetical protein